MDHFPSWEGKILKVRAMSYILLQLSVWQNSSSSKVYFILMWKKDVLFIRGDWNAKVGSQEIPGVTGKFGLGVQNEAQQRLTEFCQEKALVRANTLQETTLHMDIIRWSMLKSNWLYSLQPMMEKLYALCKNKTGSWLWLKSWTHYCKIQTDIEKSRENH